MEKKVFTDSGYEVVETMYGLDIYNEYETYLFELSGKTLADYTRNGEVDTDLIEDDIRDEIETMTIMDKFDYPYIS